MFFLLTRLRKSYIDCIGNGNSYTTTGESPLKEYMIHVKCRMLLPVAFTLLLAGGISSNGADPDFGDNFTRQQGYNMKMTNVFWESGWSTNSAAWDWDSIAKGNYEYIYQPSLYWAIQDNYIYKTRTFDDYQLAQPLSKTWTNDVLQSQSNIALPTSLFPSEFVDDYSVNPTGDGGIYYYDARTHDFFKPYGPSSPTFTYIWAIAPLVYDWTTENALSSSGIAVGAKTTDTSGWAYFTVADNAAQATEITVNIDHPHYYWTYFSITKENFPMAWTDGGLLTEPDYSSTPIGQCGYLKSPGTDGYGYDSALRCLVVKQAGDVRGALFRDTNGNWGQLAECAAQVPLSAEFNSDLAWHQDINGGIRYWIPGTNVIYSILTQSFSGAPPVGGGNDGVSLGDATPDLGRKIYLADAPAIPCGNPTLQMLPVGSVIALRLGARQWVTWKGAVGSQINRWTYNLTVKKTSSPTTSTWIDGTVISKGYTMGTDQISTLTADEAQRY